MITSNNGFEIYNTIMMVLVGNKHSRSGADTTDLQMLSSLSRIGKETPYKNPSSDVLLLRRLTKNTACSLQLFGINTKEGTLYDDKYITSVV